MQYELGFNEEAELLNGDGTGQHLFGLIPKGSAYSAEFAVSGETEIDRLRLAILQSAKALYPATGIVVYPTDWAKIEEIKDTLGRYINGIFWVLRSGAPWRDLPHDFGPYTTCYNRFVRWQRAGVWSRIMDALATAHDASVQMIDTSIIRVHQRGLHRPEPKAVHGTVSRRADHQDTCGGRYQRSPGAARANRRRGT